MSKNVIKPQKALLLNDLNNKTSKFYGHKIYGCKIWDIWEQKTPHCQGSARLAERWGRIIRGNYFFIVSFILSRRESL